MATTPTDQPIDDPRIFCNRTERDIREVRWLAFYDKSKLSFNDHLRGRFPPPDDYLFKVRVQNVREFKRSVSRKLQDNNRYEDIHLTAAYFAISSDDIRRLRVFEKTNAYVVILATNTDLQCFGNVRESFSFYIEDRLRENGDGNDVYNIHTTGKTTVRLQTDLLPEVALKEYFKVLLFGMPIK